MSVPAIQVEHLHKRYGDVVAVEDVSFEVAAGEVLGLLGVNGAGKTTTVELIAGLRTPDEGRIRVLGLDPRRDRGALRQVLGVQLQQTYLHHALTVAELVDLYRAFYPDPRPAADLLDLVELGGHARTRFEKLSGASNSDCPSPWPWSAGRAW